MLRPLLSLFALLTLLTGGVYPLVVTGLGQLLFPAQAHGSLMQRDGRVVGSALLGRAFDGAGLFQCRPSATATPWDASASGGSNLGPSSPALREAVAARVREQEGSAQRPVPVDLVTTSGSGLDPHLSPAAARWQVARVARARGLRPEVVAALVERHVEPAFLGVWGEPRVNVLALNLDLEGLDAR